MKTRLLKFNTTDQNLELDVYMPTSDIKYENNKYTHQKCIEITLSESSLSTFVFSFSCSVAGI